MTKIVTVGQIEETQKSISVSFVDRSDFVEIQISGYPDVMVSKRDLAPLCCLIDVTRNEWDKSRTVIRHG